MQGQPGESWPTSLAVTDIEGHGPRQIVEVSEPDWSYAPYLAWTPDGSGLIASGYGDGDIVELRPVQSQAEWSVTPLISWPGIQWGPPAISPDGTKIAFISYTDPTGKSLGAEAPAVYVANRNGSSPERINPKGLWGFNPTFSPSSARIAFTGFEASGDSELYVTNLKEPSPEAITNNSIDDNSPDWRPDGRIGYSRDSNPGGYSYSEFRVIDSDGKNDELVAGPFSAKSGQYWGPPSYAAIPGEPITLGPESEAKAKGLLLRFTPKLRYDSQETFRAMTANSFTDFYMAGKRTRRIEPA